MSLIFSYLGLNIISVQFSSVAQSCPTLCDAMNRSTPGLPVHHQLPEFTQTHNHRVSDAISHLILCRPLLLLPPIPPSITVFSNESQLAFLLEERGYKKKRNRFAFLWFTEVPADIILYPWASTNSPWERCPERLGKSVWIKTFWLW